MYKITSILLLGGSLLLTPEPAKPAENRIPVLLELFTSEGCSSCPPADRLLANLDKEQPIPGADLIVISEHVDYWNHLGWADPFSSAFYSARQRTYMHFLKTDDVYTPQLVVDGHAGFVGSDKAAAVSAIRQSLQDTKLPITVTAAQSGNIHIEAPAHPEGQSKLDLYVVLAADHARSQVNRGENSGSTLSHVAVAYSFKKVGTWNAAEALNRDIHVDLKPGQTRVIAFVQNPQTSRTTGAAQTSIAFVR